MNTEINTMLSEEQKKELLNCIDCNIGTFTLEGKEFFCKIVNVYDADTCRAVFYLNNKLVKYTIRLKGIDSPEMRPPSKDKYRNYQIIEAKKSRNKLIQLCTDCDIKVDSLFTKKKIQTIINDNKKLIRIKCEEFDKYGRLLATLYDDDKPINELLIKEGYAYIYDGGTKKQFDYSKYAEKETEKET
jgi:endonuclease YncB( thermonuclease family)